jgi:nucleotidyltransferase/DNA polymerase involved in DNA repair
MFVTSEGPILHADLDAFYASVEQRDDDRLDRPLGCALAVQETCKDVS